MSRFSNKLTPDAEQAFGEYNFKTLFEGYEIPVDYRLPENRKELFFRYFKWRVTTHDLDHTHYMNILCRDYDYEQKAWFAMTFGMTYRTPQCFAYTETFPDFHAIKMEELKEWHDKNWKRTTYGTDARYNKGHFYSQVYSVKVWLGGKTFKQKFDSILVHDNENKNFWALYNEILGLYKFGRMTGWLTLQALHDLLHLPIDPNEIMLTGFSPNNDSSLQSIWNGLCALENKHNMMVGKYGDYVVTASDTSRAAEMLLEYTSQAEQYAGFKIDSFRKESIWCQYKRMFNEDCSKEYPGHASGDATSRYMYYRDNWPEIDWSKFREALRTQPGYVKGMTFVPWMNGVFSKTGLLMNMSEMYSDMPNAYEVMNINRSTYLVKEIWTDDNLPVPTEVCFNTDLSNTPSWYKKI